MTVIYYLNYFFIKHRECQGVILPLISSSTDVEITFNNIKERLYEPIVENEIVCLLLSDTVRHGGKRFITFFRGEL